MRLFRITIIGIDYLFPGNHSAGKSSFINWYIEEHVQRTGVAIETQGFSFVTSGKKRESLTGNATLHLYPHFKPLAQVNYLWYLLFILEFYHFFSPDAQLDGLSHN